MVGLEGERGFPSERTFAAQPAIVRNVVNSQAIGSDQTVWHHENGHNRAHDTVRLIGRPSIEEKHRRGGQQ